MFSLTLLKIVVTCLSAGKTIFVLFLTNISNNIVLLFLKKIEFRMKIKRRNNRINKLNRRSGFTNRDLKQRGRERERRRLRKIKFLVRSLLLCAGHLSFVSFL